MRAEYGAPRAYLQDEVLPYTGEDCLIWPYYRIGKGYAAMAVDGKPQLVTRIVCTEVHGPPPTDKHEAAHSCGKGHLGCVTPGHLSWKTRKENSDDRLVHGTDLRGEKSPFCKLSDAEVREIMGRRGSVSIRQLSIEYGVSWITIQRIHRGETRSWLFT